MIHNKHNIPPKPNQTQNPDRVRHEGGGAPGPKYTIPVPPPSNPNPPKK